jgi:para-aminobenzoate synthetase/4-amino-4-deoxychorismate lyase
MIVDLMRNDLGRVAATGAVRVPALLAVQPHPGVWHLVSTVSAQLRAEVGDAALLRATFPPGSVTGAPKLRALTAIADLEPLARGSYTGAIGFASPLWGAEFSVAIRTFEIGEGRIELGVGGGITADSVPVLEWRECLDKGAPLVAAAGAVLAPALRRPAAAPDPVRVEAGLLETILGLDGGPVRLADHLARLDRSCRELYGAGLPVETAEQVRAAAKAQPTGRAVLRVVVGPDLAVRVSAAAVGRPPTASELVSTRRVQGSWRHKWADRSWTEGAGGAAAALFVDDAGRVLETARGNVFLIEADGTLVTAPLTDDVLPGVTRRALLDAARDEGRGTALRAFGIDELCRRPAFWTSSLSGAVPIHRVDGMDLPRADRLVHEFGARLFGGESAVR